MKYVERISWDASVATRVPASCIVFRYLWSSRQQSATLYEQLLEREAVYRGGDKNKWFSFSRDTSFNRSGLYAHSHRAMRANEVARKTKTHIRGTSCSLPSSDFALCASPTRVQIENANLANAHCTSPPSIHAFRTSQFFSFSSFIFFFPSIHIRIRYGLTVVRPANSPRRWDRTGREVEV